MDTTKEKIESMIAFVNRKHDTRESWLEAAVLQLDKALFQPHGHQLPAGIKVSCGFPSKSALARKGRRIGECWQRESSEGAKQIHIFISPLLADRNEILATVSHELIHALRPKAGHHGPFKAVAKQIGLVGKATATVAGPELIHAFKPIVSQLGDYPHARLIALGKEPKTQSTRLLKAECPECGYVIRVTKKWADTGLPVCVCGAEFTLADNSEGE